MRWLIVFVLVSLVFSGLRGWLAKIGLGQLPGDITLRWRGRALYLPITSALLFSVLAGLVGLFI